MDCRPSDLLAAVRDLNLQDSIATDTETSGLFADDGARVSTASVAFIAEPEDGWAEWAARWDNVTYEAEIIHPDAPMVYILSTAWPFDQGTEGKPEDNGQPKLWPDAENLGIDEWEALLTLLSEYDLDFHNAKFDLEKYRVGVRRWPGVGKDLEGNLLWDTQNVNHLVFPHLKDAGGNPTTSLKPTCAQLFGKEWADEGEAVKKYLTKSKLPAGRWDLMPWDVIGTYADTDARITKMLKLRQIWEIEHCGAGSWLGTPNEVLNHVTRRLLTTTTLYRMERRGVPYDEVTSRMAADECEKRAERVAAKLPFEPTGNKAKHYFFGDGKTDKGVECQSMVPYSVTDKGSPQLTAEILLRMVDDRVVYAPEYAEYRRVSNAASMWYTGYADAIGSDGRLRCAFRQNGTRSSRFSVERVNLQAIPQDYRLSDHQALVGIPTPRQIIANAVPDGWRLFELDLAQAELRVGTMIAGCKLMRQMIVDGEDLHTFTTKALFPEVDPEDPLFHAKWRQVGKRGNFSLQFGAKGKTFRAMVSKETGIVLEEHEADRIVADWNALYPEFGDAINLHQDRVMRRQSRHGYGWVQLYNRERRWFQEDEEAHKAFNQRVQGNLAQFGIDWMLRTETALSMNGELQERAKEDGIGEPGLVLTIHDSQVLLLPDDEFGRSLADECAGFGRSLWKTTFADIPGDVDFHAWDRADTSGWFK